MAEAAPHPFQTALGALGVAASEAMHVGDSYANDIVPALELGMTAVLLRGRGNEGQSDPPPHHVISGLDELLAIFLG